MRSIVIPSAAALIAIGGIAHAQSTVALPANPGQGMDTTSHVDSGTGVTTQDSSSGSTALPANAGAGLDTSAHVDSSTGAMTGTATGGTSLQANAGQGEATTARTTTTTHTRVRHHRRRPG